MMILIVMTSFFALFVSIVGTTVLLVPIVMNLAAQVGCVIPGVLEWL